MRGHFTIYTDLSTLTESNLKNLSPLLAFHWNDLSLEAILAGESNSESPFTLTTTIADSDWVALPMHWTYYLWNQKARMPEAAALAKLAEENRKQLVIWFKGDLVPVVPFENASVFLPGLIASKARTNQYACPVFIDDPDPVWTEGHERVRSKTEKPTVGFCGYGSVGSVKLLWSMMKGVQLNASRLLGRSDYDAIPIVPATLLRSRAMRLLEKDERINTAFLIRDRYTARSKANSRSATTQTAESFYSNIYETDYTLCMRGFGNWSYRFYETLACGRIPVFIDSDCVLPLDSKIDWKRYCVWVDSSELHLIGEKILEFHSSLSAADFKELQIECRKLWIEHLSHRGFMQNLQFYFETTDRPAAVAA